MSRKKSLINSEAAQHRVHPTGGTLHVFRQFLWLEAGSVKDAFSRPAHQRVTPTVRRSTSQMFENRKKSNYMTMRNSSIESSSSTAKVFYLAAGWRFTLMGTGIVGLLFPVVFIVLFPEIRSDSVPFFIFFWLLAGELLYEAWKSRLLLTSEGIVYYQPRYTIAASWSDIEVIKINPNFFEISTINPPVTSLILKKPSLQSNFIITRLLKSLGNLDCIIPLTPYMNTSIGSELIKEIHAHAPHLFQERAKILV